MMVQSSEIEQSPASPSTPAALSLPRRQPAFQFLEPLLEVTWVPVSASFARVPLICRLPSLRRREHCGPCPASSSVFSVSVARALSHVVTPPQPQSGPLCDCAALANLASPSHMEAPVLSHWGRPCASVRKPVRASVSRHHPPRKLSGHLHSKELFCIVMKSSFQWLSATLHV